MQGDGRSCSFRWHLAPEWCSMCGGCKQRLARVAVEVTPGALRSSPLHLDSRNTDEATAFGSVGDCSQRYGRADRPQTAPETDPLGKAAGEAGAKLDAGKPRPGLVFGGFSLALDAVCKVGTDGAVKYSDDGWLQVPDGIARYTDAMLRHQLSEGRGETHDGSGSRHAAHVVWNALARLELMLRRERDA